MNSLTPSLALKSILLLAVGILGFAACKPKVEAFKTPPKTPEFSLVKDGKPQATIVIAKEPSKATLFAVQELNEHLGLVAGAKLPVVDDAAQVKGPRVLVGESAATRALGINTADFKHQEYLVRATTDTLVLLGKEEAATIENPAGIFVPGKWGKALSFDGKTTILDIPKSGFNDAEGTLECWVLMDGSASGAILRLSGEGLGGIPGVRTGAKDHVILLRQGNAIRYRSIADGKESALDSRPIPAGWHHVMATHSTASGKIELFIDGQSQGTAPYTPTMLGNQTLYVGAFRGLGLSGGLWTPLKGEIDEIRISKVARPAGIPSEPFAKDAETTLLLHCDGSPEEPTATIERKRALPNRIGEIGTLYAVYDILEKAAGVRWYAPGEIGRAFEKKPDVGVNLSDRRFVPAMVSRTMSPEALFLDTPENKFGLYDMNLFMLRLRVGGSSYVMGNHSFGGYYDRFSKAYGKNPARLEEDRPEFFAQGLTEEQMKAPNVAGGQPNLNYSSQALVEQVVKDARAQFDKDAKSAELGGAQASYFPMGPMDMAPYSKDPESEAASRPPRDAIDRGMRSDYWFGFVNKVARELRKSHPDNWVTCLAYYDFLEYPEKVGIEPNVIITLAALYGAPSGVWDPARKERQRRVEEGWFKYSKKSPVYMWLYYDTQSLAFGNFIYPEACAWAVPPFMKRLHEAGIKGVFDELCSETRNSYLFCQLENYLTLMLAFDATLDGEAMINEFFTKYYGAAAEPMKQLYRELEEVKFDLNNYPESVRAGTKYQSFSPELACKHLLTPERMTKWTALLDNALANAQGVHKERVQQYKTGVWDRMSAERAKFLAK